MVSFLFSLIGFEKRNRIRVVGEVGQKGILSLSPLCFIEELCLTECLVY